MTKLSAQNCFFLLVLFLATSSARAKIHVQVVNLLHGERPMNIHCQSADDDLGYHVLEHGGAIEWSFNLNFWATTLFYCDVQWDGSVWYHFDAYDAQRDYWKCGSTCHWMISGDGALYGYSRDTGLWEWYPMSAES